MRKIILTIALSLYTGFAFCQNLNASQQKLKSDIFNYLKKETTNLSDYSKNELKFTIDGVTHFVSISTTDFAPMYVTLSTGWNLPEDFDNAIVAKISQQLNLYKGVKSYSGDGYIKFQSEMFLNDSKPFINVFNRLIEIMSSMKKTFDEEYEKAKSQKPTSSSFTSQFTKQNNVYIWPQGYSASKNLFVTKVTLDKNNTILDFTSYNGGQYQYCSIDRNSYLLVNGKRYNLIKAEGIAYSPEHTDYPNYQTGNNVSLSFKLYFQPIPTGTTTFDFIESSISDWNTKSITLEDANIIKAPTNQIETSVHKWSLLSVQCMKSQTIICKKVTPKNAGTYINSSQEEFIEDADTGRKYYLTKSEIGFEDNKLVLFDTKERSFYEIYPALPANVKRINVSSGSQYYVKNLTIR